MTKSELFTLYSLINISNAFITRINNVKQRIESVVIKSPRQMVMEQSQRIDDLARTLDIIMSAKMQRAQQQIANMAMFENILQPRMTSLQQSVLHMGQMLESLSYKNVLNRGYAIVRDVNGTIISSVASTNKIATVEFADGVAKI